ncbi:ribbon-helix-helix protein, CopG family [Candidatus Gottesmanbacteria bacterium]|nr:ribbon-helix-helix protein, CopG family [Candidatus Gottesmanbacteria bacterium]
MMTQTFNIALPTNLVKRADLVARREYRNRSELIREALRVYLNDAKEWEELLDFGKKQAKKMGIKSEQDVNKIVAAYRKGK